MKKFLKIAALLLVAGWTVSMNSCMTFRKSDKKTIQHFNKKGLPVEVKRVTYEGKAIRYVVTGCQDEDCPLVVFLHGAPGASDAYFEFMEDSLLRQKARMISIDRPGYGYSTYGKAETSMYQQAAAVNAVVQEFSNPSIVLVGHSYGGPIIGKYAVDFPDRVKGILMVAPVNDPDSEKEFWYAHIGKWSLTRWMLSKAFRVSADEKFSHIEELRKMIPDWQKLKVPVTHIHAKKDKLAPFENIAFSKKHIPNHLLKTVELDKGNHLLIFNRVDLVRDELLLLLERH